MRMEIAFLDCISHGDCTVITFPEGSRRACIVVDGGENDDSAKALESYLKASGVKTIDLMVGTHIDSDHINGLKYFVKAQLARKRKGKPYVRIKRFWGPQPSEAHVADVMPASVPEIGEPGDTISWQDYVIQSVKQNDDLFEALGELGVSIEHPALDDKPRNPFRGVRLELLGPDTQIPADHIKRKALGGTTRFSQGMPITSLDSLRAALTSNFSAMAIEAKRNANNQSIVLRVTPGTGSSRAAKKWTFLLTGDAEEEAWDEMLSASRVAAKLPSQVLKIPHHGSALNGITAAGAQKVAPLYSVNLVGQKHGLPDAATMQTLHGLNSTILCTQRNNDPKHKSDCFSVPSQECPAKGKPRNVCFSIDLGTGHCTTTPANRACGHAW